MPDQDDGAYLRDARKSLRYDRLYGQTRGGKSRMQQDIINRIIAQYPDTHILYAQMSDDALLQGSSDLKDMARGFLNADLQDFTSTLGLEPTYEALTIDSLDAMMKRVHEIHDQYIQKIKGDIMSQTSARAVTCDWALLTPDSDPCTGPRDVRLIREGIEYLVCPIHGARLLGRG